MSNARSLLCYSVIVILQIMSADHYCAVMGSKLKHATNECSYLVYSFMLEKMKMDADARRL
jgi:hypothetical protein